MNEGKIKQYDTVKDKDGNRYRVVEVGSDGKGHVIAKLKGITPDNKAKRGPARLVEVGELEASYTRIDLPPVPVVQPARPTENAMQKQRETVEAYNHRVNKEAVEFFEDLKEAAYAQLKEDYEVLQEDKKYMERQLEIADQDVTELKKTISKMKDAHDEEVRALEDEIMELKILAKKAGQYSDALDDDSVVFGKIHMLATTLKGLATSIEGIALLIQDETEGKI